MSTTDVPLFGYYSWQYVPDVMIPNVFAEFKANGVEHLVFSHVWMTRILREPAFFAPFSGGNFWAKRRLTFRRLLLQCA